MIQKEVQEIIEGISRQYGKPVYVVEELWKAQWKFLKEVISKSVDIADFKTVKFPKWGKYYLSKRKLEYIRIHNPSGKKKHGRNKNEGNDKTDTGLTNRSEEK